MLVSGSRRITQRSIRGNLYLNLYQIHSSSATFGVQTGCITSTRSARQHSTASRCSFHTNGDESLSCWCRQQIVLEQQRRKTRDWHRRRGGLSSVFSLGPHSTQSTNHFSRHYSTHVRRQRNVFVALGSNIGDSVAHIEDACQRIDQDADMRIIDTSYLYETEPMYVQDQARFINGACEIETTLSPNELLDRLQAIERAMGRQKIIDKGPRNVDLDIIGYADQVLQSDRLTIPHALLHERAFVLKPLNDLINGPTWLLPTTKRSARDHLSQLGDHIDTVTPLREAHLSLRSNASHTVIMSILNITPDSFSDGGNHFASSQADLNETIHRHIREGAQIIDIGGQSSRPNAQDVGAEEELARVLPVIETIRSMPEARQIAISVDTYRASVAKASIEAGADIINDVSAGVLDKAMLPTVAQLGCTYIMMHMRGAPSTMLSIEENHPYADGVAETLSAELALRLQAAIDAGIRRWRIILDPGLGFAKDTQTNVSILRQLPDIRARFPQMPWLIGSSKKRFVGAVTGVVAASDRLWGTAATVTAAVAGGADIVRVHDVAEMRQVAAMADAIYKSS